MKLGTQIRLPDGREATVVFNGLTGVGVKFGLHDPDPADFEGTTADLAYIGIRSTKPPGFRWEPDAMLRAPDLAERFGIECVGEEYEVLRDGRGAVSNQALEEITKGEAR